MAPKKPVEAKRCKRCGACEECGALPQPQIVPMPYPVYPPYARPNPYWPPQRPYTWISLGSNDTSNQASGGNFQ